MILILKQEYDHGYRYYALKGIFETEDKLRKFAMDTARQFFTDFKVWNDFKEEYEFNFLDRNNIMSDPRNGGYNSYLYIHFDNFNQLYDEIIPKDGYHLKFATDFIDIMDHIFIEIDAYNTEVRRRKEEEKRPTKEKILRKINKLEKELLDSEKELEKLN
jgi:hypothetical protein